MQLEQTSSTTSSHPSFKTLRQNGKENGHWLMPRGLMVIAWSISHSWVWIWIRGSTYCRALLNSMEGLIKVNCSFDSDSKAATLELQESTNALFTPRCGLNKESKWKKMEGKRRRKGEGKEKRERCVIVAAKRVHPRSQATSEVARSQGRE